MPKTILVEFIFERVREVTWVKLTPLLTTHTGLLPITEASVANEAD